MGTQQLTSVTNGATAQIARQRQTLSSRTQLGQTHTESNLLTTTNGNYNFSICTSNIGTKQSAYANSTQLLQRLVRQQIYATTQAAENHVTQNFTGTPSISPPTL
jgi:hypothetical protein